MSNIAKTKLLEELRFFFSTTQQRLLFLLLLLLLWYKASLTEIECHAMFLSAWLWLSPHIHTDSCLITQIYTFYRIWDWEAGVKQNQFYNHNSKTCKITGLEYLNPHNSDRTLLAVATGKHLLDTSINWKVVLWLDGLRWWPIPVLADPLIKTRYFIYVTWKKAWSKGFVTNITLLYIQPQTFT